MFTSKQSLNMWEQVGSRLFAISDSSTWWIADWLVYGETTFQDRYEEAIKRTSLSYQTLRNYTWVARRFPLPRRRPGLSFSHHLEVVALEQPEQDYWLRKAEELSWSRNKLRAEIKGSLLTRRGEPALPDVEGSTGADGVDTAAGSAPAAARGNSGPTPEARLLHLELSAEDLSQLKRAANRDGEPLETWAAAILRQAASRS
ncbi:LmbU family transcriptional regulator [Nonomuraea sp. NPDC050786]|uniref:LmbU family transcriptional regulator n=1 Tax=Nonomuraea sp. NPDC050786 TaxID=3154840 RepID=UPI0033CDB2E7